MKKGIGVTGDLDVEFGRDRQKKSQREMRGGGGRERTSFWQKLGFNYTQKQKGVEKKIINLALEEKKKKTSSLEIMRNNKSVN